MATKKRTKAPAQEHVPSTRDDCARQITLIGNLQRQHERLQGEMNDKIAAITDQYAAPLELLAKQISALSAGVQTWCEASRPQLTQDGKFKSHDFLTGVVNWRLGLPSVSVTGADAVIKTLRNLGLVEFIRTKEEVNKEAILANFSAAEKITPASISGELDAEKQMVLIRVITANEMLQGLSGIKLKPGAESFSITPVSLESSEVPA